MLQICYNIQDFMSVFSIYGTHKLILFEQVLINRILQLAEKIAETVSVGLNFTAKWFE